MEANALSTSLRLVPLPRCAVEEPPNRSASTVRWAETLWL